jgi:hypothetical protein
VLSLLNPESRLPLNAVANSLLTITKLDASSSAVHIARVLRHMIFTLKAKICVANPHTLVNIHRLKICRPGQVFHSQ